MNKSIHDICLCLYGSVTLNHLIYTIEEVYSIDDIYDYKPYEYNNSIVYQTGGTNF